MKLKFINDTLKNENIESIHDETLLRYYEINQNTVLITKQSEFNRFAKLLGEDTIDIQPGEVKVVKFKKSKFGHTEELLEQTISLTSA